MSTHMLSMYEIFTYIWFKFTVNIGKSSIHGANGLGYFTFVPKNLQYGCFQK